MPRCAEPSCGRWRPAAGFGPAFLSRLRLNGQWYCSERCVERAALQGIDGAPGLSRSAIGRPASRLGVLLRHMRVLGASDLERALERQRASGLPLGAQLIEMRCVEADHVLRALAAQAGVSYLSAFDARQIRGAAMLPAEMVRALGLVPFELDEVHERLHVACAAPVPRLALRALAKLTGWTPVPYLVHDDVWEDALDAYRPAAPERHDAIAVTSAGAAAAHVARRASMSGVVTMRSVDLDRYIWVRVETPQHVSDLLVTGQMEEACQAAHTAH